MNNESVYPYEAWINHYKLGICRVTVVGLDWYRETQRTDDWPIRVTVLVQFKDGLLTNVMDAENNVFATEAEALEDAIRDAHLWITHERTERITEREGRILTYTERLARINSEDKRLNEYYGAVNEGNEG